MKKALFLLIACVFSTHLFAQTEITVPNAGSLSEILVTNKIEVDTLTKLKLTGFVDVRDFRTLQGARNSLEYIDMSDLCICEYTEAVKEKTTIYFKYKIPHEAFSDFFKLEAVIFPNGSYENKNILTWIGDKAFKRTAIKNIVLPNTLKHIGMEAFQFCNNLTSVNIPDSVIGIYSRAFSDCASLREITVSNKNNIFSSHEGVLLSKNGKKTHQYPAGRKAVLYEFPPNILEIGIGAFDGCLHLKEIIFPDSLMLMYDMSRCKSLETIKVNYVKFNFRIPPSVTSVYISDTKVPEWDYNWVFRNMDLSKITLYVHPELISDYKKDPNFGPNFNYVAWVPTNIKTLNAENRKFYIYPNPVKDYFSIKGLDKLAMITLIDMNGKSAYSGVVSDETPISIAYIEKGIYILSIRYDNIIYNTKLYKL